MRTNRSLAATSPATDTLPLLATFAIGGAELLQARELLSRVDRKYLLPKRLLPSLLAQLRDDYHLLPAAGRAVATYRTSYFDTAERDMFHDHRRGRCPRTKVRIRHHVDRQLSFLEIKQKQHGARTTKVRTEIPFGAEQFDATGGDVIDAHCPYPARALSACITNEFVRLTLLGEDVDERLTIDWDMNVGDDHRSLKFPEAVIVEVKQARYSNASPAMRALRQLRVREGAISKYCLATVQLATVRQNLFKPALRSLELLSA